MLSVAPFLASYLQNKNKQENTITDTYRDKLKQHILWAKVQDAEWEFVIYMCTSLCSIYL